MSMVFLSQRLLGYITCLKMLPCTEALGLNYVNWDTQRTRFQWEVQALVSFNPNAGASIEVKYIKKKSKKQKAKNIENSDLFVYIVHYIESYLYII